MNGQLAELLLTVTVGGAVVVALVLELFPERIDLLTAVLSGTGLGTVVGSFYGWLRGASRQRRALYAEDFALALRASPCSPSPLARPCRG